MKTLLYRYLAITFLLLLAVNFAWAKSKTILQSDNLKKLELQPSSNKINHVFHITIPKRDFKKLTKTDSIEKNFLSNCTLTYNDDTLDVDEIELRGKSSMNFSRKSFSVKLNDKVEFSNNEVNVKFKKFNLISLSMDQNYYRNKVAFDLMKHLGLFNLFYDYAEVLVNGKSQGVYLMLQKPKNYAFKKENADVMFRRDYDNIIKKSYYRDEDTVQKARCEKEFLRIYSDIVNKSAEEFYKELSDILDVEQYFTWMAFNYLIGNRDYTDEVFFYNKANDNSIKFGIIPWDYDDIFFDYPHEGYIIRHVNFGDKLAFSSEDELDYKLITDHYTYVKYLENFIKVIEKLTIPVIKEIFESTYQELYPFYCNKDIIAMSKVDKYGRTNLRNLKSDMQQCYEKLVHKRETTANKIILANIKSSAVN